MAEHRPVSRYRPNIAADTSQLLHNIHGTRPEYSQVYRKSDGMPLCVLYRGCQLVLVADLCVSNVNNGSDDCRSIYI